VLTTTRTCSLACVDNNTTSWFIDNTNWRLYHTRIHALHSPHHLAHVKWSFIRVRYMRLGESSWVKMQGWGIEAQCIFTTQICIYAWEAYSLILAWSSYKWLVSRASLLPCRSGLSCKTNKMVWFGPSAWSPRTSSPACCKLSLTPDPFDSSASIAAVRPCDAAQWTGSRPCSA